MDILEIFEYNLSYLAIIVMFVIFLLGLKKGKNKKLLQQVLIDANLYKKKIELIVSRVEDIYGKDFNTFPTFQQKIVMDSLKKDIKSKVKLNSEVIDETSLDSLIDAVDKKIDKSKRI